MACCSYTIDVCAAEFGACKCGFPKSAHAQAAPQDKKHKKKHKSKKFKMGGAPKASKEKSAAAPELPAGSHSSVSTQRGRRGGRGSGQQIGERERTWGTWG